MQSLFPMTGDISEAPAAGTTTRTVTQWHSTKWMTPRITLSVPMTALTWFEQRGFPIISWNAEKYVLKTEVTLHKIKNSRGNPVCFSVFYHNFLFYLQKIQLDDCIKYKWHYNNLVIFIDKINPFRGTQMCILYLKCSKVSNVYFFFIFEM